MKFKPGQLVEVKEPRGGKWLWSGRVAEILECDQHCANYRYDDTGEESRDVVEHLRPYPPE